MLFIFVYCSAVQFSLAYALQECASFLDFKSFKALNLIYLVQMFKSRGSEVLLSWLLFMFNTFSDFGTDVFTTNGSQEHNGPGLLKVPGLECS